VDKLSFLQLDSTARGLQATARYSNSTPAPGATKSIIRKKIANSTAAGTPSTAETTAIAGCHGNSENTGNETVASNSRDVSNYTSNSKNILLFTSDNNKR
jgi:hypothetical protein